MDTLTIILIALTATLLIANIVMFVMERTATKHELNFDKSKVKIIILASEDERELVKSEVEMTNKYYVLDSTNGYLKTEHGYIYIRAYLVEIK